MQSAADILRQRLEGQDIPASAREAALGEAEQVIKNYCNRPFVPWQLNYTWANMAADIIKGREGMRAGGIPDHEVASIRAGDMTVTRGAEFAAHRVDLDGLTRVYAAELDGFRKFRWGL